MLKFFRHLEEWFLGTLIAFATLMVFLSVLHRYMSGWAIPYLQDWLLTWRVSWIQELSIIIFVWMAKFGAAYGVKTGIHVSVDILFNKASSGWKALMVIISYFGGAIFTFVLVLLGANLIWENGANFFYYSLLGHVPEGIYPGPISPDLEWRTWVIYLAVPLGSGLMCFRFLTVLFNYFKTKELPRHVIEVPGVKNIKDLKEI